MAVTCYLTERLRDLETGGHLEQGLRAQWLILNQVCVSVPRQNHVTLDMTAKAWGLIFPLLIYFFA